MAKLIGIGSYDAALPAAYQQGGPLAGKGCGCSGLGKSYNFSTTIPGTTMPQKMAVDVPINEMANDAAQSIWKWSVLLAVGTATITSLILFSGKKFFR
jgi:hypothetical protein